MYLLYISPHRCSADFNPGQALTVAVSVAGLNPKLSFTKSVCTLYERQATVKLRICYFGILTLRFFFK